MISVKDTYNNIIESPGPFTEIKILDVISERMLSNLEIF